MPESTEQLQGIEELDSRVDALMKEIDSAGGPAPAPAQGAPQPTSARPAPSAATTAPQPTSAEAATPKPSPAAPKTAAPDALLSSVSDEIEVVAPGPLAPPHPPSPVPPPPPEAAQTPAAEPEQSAAAAAPESAPVTTPAMGEAIAAAAAPAEATPSGGDVDALIEKIGQDLEEQASFAAAAAGAPDADFVSPEAIQPSATPVAKVSPAGSIRDLDAVLAENAEQAVEEAAQEAAPRLAPPMVTTAAGPAAQAGPASTPGPSPAARPADPVPAISSQPVAAGPAPTPAPIPAATPPSNAAGLAEPKVGIGAAIAGALIRPLSPIATFTERLGESGRQTLGYIAVMTLFFAAVTWTIVVIRKPDDGHSADAGFPFVRQDDPPVAPRPRPAPAHEAAAEHGSGGSHAEPADAHGAKKKDDGHGSAKKAEEKKPDPKKDSHASASSKKAPPKAHASAEHH